MYRDPRIILFVISTLSIPDLHYMSHLTITHIKLFCQFNVLVSKLLLKECSYSLQILYKKVGIFPLTRLRLMNAEVNLLCHCPTYLHEPDSYSTNNNTVCIYIQLPIFYGQRGLIIQCIALVMTWLHAWCIYIAYANTWWDMSTVLCRTSKCCFHQKSSQSI